MGYSLNCLHILLYHIEEYFNRNLHVNVCFTGRLICQYEYYTL